MIGIFKSKYRMQMYALKERYAKKNNRTANLTGDLKKRLNTENWRVLGTDWLVDGKLDSVELLTGLIISLGSAQAETLAFFELVWFKYIEQIGK